MRHRVHRQDLVFLWLRLKIRVIPTRNRVQPAPPGDASFDKPHVNVNIEPLRFFSTDVHICEDLTCPIRFPAVGVT